MIRKYRDADIDAVVHVWLASTIPGQAFIDEAAWRVMEPEVRDDLLPRAETWVVEEDSQVIAFVSMIGDVIGGLFTHPAHQGKGHGLALVERARERRSPLFVEVFEANDAAIRFYRRRGFTDHERAIDEGSGLPMLLLRMADEGSAR